MVASDDRGGQAVSRRWRFYETGAGRRPAREFLDGLDEEDRVSVVATMTRVRRLGLSRARHLSGAIWEVRAEGQAATFRVLFSPEGRSGAHPARDRGVLQEDPEDAARAHRRGGAKAGRLADPRRMTSYHMWPIIGDSHG